MNDLTASRIDGAFLLARKYGWCSIKLKGEDVPFTVIVSRRPERGEDGLFRIPQSPCGPATTTKELPKDETDLIRRLTIALKKCAFANASPEALRQVARDALKGKDGPTSDGRAGPKHRIGAAKEYGVL